MDEHVGWKNRLLTRLVPAAAIFSALVAADIVLPKRWPEWCEANLGWLAAAQFSLFVTAVYLARLGLRG